MGLLSYLARPDVRRDPYRLAGRRLRFEVERYVLGRRIREQTVRFDSDLLITIDPVNVVERAIYFYGYHEFRMTQLFSRLISVGRTGLDAGAHIGQYTLLASKAVGPSGLVIAAEPNPENVLRLHRNIELNRLSNVRVLPVALADRNGRASMYLALDDEATATGSLRSHSDGDRSLEVETVALDSLELARLDVIKMDVEGAEPALVAGGLATLARYRPSILFEVFSDVAQYRSPEKSTETIDMLRGLGYRIYGLTGRRGDAVTEVIAGADLIQFKEAWSALNLLAVHSVLPAPP